ncbi:Phasin protein [Legionella lansingensis]|uniref:Phasin protein n=1 Tax=Legionella lansingensis TaxID=45067 RepID=A0A0W0VR88_9GAMM|nr:Phasin protein [Legionella lansingensis]SNV56056.1 Phasin protein [Legionella lansingensis]
MNQRYLEQWTEIAKHIQRPFQAMLELNVDTMRNFQFLKAEDLVDIRSPEEFLEKQVNLAIENGHHALNYFQKSFSIFEQVLQPLTDTVKKSTKSTMDTAKSFKTLWDPTKLAMGPTKAAIDITKPLLDPTFSAMDPRTVVMEVASSFLTPMKSGKTKSSSQKLPLGKEGRGKHRH